MKEALARLDTRLSAACARMATDLPGAARDSFRGLYIDSAEVERLLVRTTGEPSLWSDWADAADPWLIRLRERFSLDAFEADALLLALAPEIDLRYERLYAYLQDDVTRRRPTVDLALNLLCATGGEKIACRSYFAPDAPLLRQSLLRLTPDPSHAEPTLLSHFLRADEQVVSLLLGQRSLDSRLVECCEYFSPKRTDAHPRLRALAWHDGPVRLYFHGPDTTAKRAAAAAMAAEIGAPLLIADLANSSEATLKLAMREAWLVGAVLLAEGITRLPDGDVRIAIASATQPCAWPGAVVIEFGRLDYVAREACWAARLNDAGITSTHSAELAARFSFTTTQIASAVRNAGQYAVWRGSTTVSKDDLFAAARSECGHALALLARKIEPRNTWNDLVAPSDVLEQLRELCSRAALRARVVDEWGFQRKLASSKGVTALFSGPSGTGKTLAAEVVAAALQLDLYKIDLSGVVSKYIGETEKNLDRIFVAAEDANAILFFDEADALFGKRSEVRDSHDRYANLEIAYLLQKMEEYEGVAILATNLRQNLDESFTRRLTFSVHFPFPDERCRESIWQRIFPDATPIKREVDFGWLAKRFKLSGGNIRNIAIAAAFLAASDNEPVGIDHILQAVRREFQKLGKQLNPSELLEEVAS